jgi:hypothetical protein
MPGMLYVGMSEVLTIKINGTPLEVKLKKAVLTFSASKKLKEKPFIYISLENLHPRDLTNLILSFCWSLGGYPCLLGL